MHRIASSNPASDERCAEAALIRRAQRQDPAALRELIDRHKDRLFAFVWRMQRNHHDAEEICQEAFLKAFAALDSFDPSYRFSTWLFTIAYRLTLNALRKRKPTGGEIDFGTLAGDQDEPDDHAARSEEAARLTQVIWAAVDKLTSAQRAAVLLFYKQQQSCQEIADVLELPVATVKSHLHRARARLRDLLAAHVDAESTGERILNELVG